MYNAVDVTVDTTRQRECYYLELLWNYIIIHIIMDN